MDKKTKLKDFLKKIFSVLIVILAGIAIFEAFRAGSFTLTIDVEPNDSLVTVSNNFKSTGDFKMKLKRANYTIKVEREGFIGHTQQINLNKNTELNISLASLFQNTINAENVIPIDIPNLGGVSAINGNISYGINTGNGNLVKFENNKLTTIFSGTVKDFDIKNDTAVVLSDSDLTKVILIDLETLAQRTMNLEQYAPIISATVSNDLSTVYFLAEFSIESKTPVLYSIPVNGGEATKIIETRALEVRFVKEGLLALFEKVHAENKNIFHAFVTEGNLDIYKKNVDSYRVSPDSNNIYLQTTSDITVLNTNDFKTKTLFTGSGSRATWKDNNTILIFKNDDNGINYATLTIDSFILSPFSVLIKDTAIQSVYGVIGNELFLQDYQGRVISVKIP